MVVAVLSAAAPPADDSDDDAAGGVDEDSDAPSLPASADDSLVGNGTMCGYARACELEQNIVAMSIMFR